MGLSELFDESVNVSTKTKLVKPKLCDKLVVSWIFSVVVPIRQPLTHTRGHVVHC